MATKKAVATKAPKSSLAELTASPDKAFWMCNGEMIARLGDLPGKLKNIDDSIFSQHVNSEKNDFANWIDGVFQNGSLAKKLSKVKTKAAMIKALNESFSA